MVKGRPAHGHPRVSTFSDAHYTDIVVKRYGRETSPIVTFTISESIDKVISIILEWCHVLFTKESRFDCIRLERRQDTLNLTDNIIEHQTFRDSGIIGVTRIPSGYHKEMNVFNSGSVTIMRYHKYHCETLWRSNWS
ncbi:hypothetical protein NPIL_561341 [Nephila pilipes]|uniref:Uncharacterized protein n=1 Tax=Nephila pilipes TaxID=299642 RepID=A0A8X6QU38_NEPPI|nr:hypothetical protein NPIL_561341 [Nephila pilipes]